MLSNHILIVVASILSATKAIDVLPRLLGTFHIAQAAFVELHRTEDPSVPVKDSYTLFISTFNPAAVGSHDPIWFMSAPGRYLDNASGWNLSIIDMHNFWPNNPDFMPKSVVGEEGIVWTSGFLVPSKTQGQLMLYKTNVNARPEGHWNIASNDDKDYSYHRVIWKDMDGDGDLDALAARFHSSLTGAITQNLVWLENPNQGLVEGWTQHLLVDGGPDVHIRTISLNVDGTDYDVIFAAEFFNELLTLLYVSDGSNDWAKTELIERLVIDPEPGQTFDLFLDDINRDGKIDIICTGYNHTLGNVFAYEIPSDFRSEPFTRRTLADGFKPNFILGGQSMSPGTPHTFYPSAEYENQVGTDGRQVKPWMLVSGDDDGKQYILKPESEDVNDWTYSKNVLIDTEKTTAGKYSAADIDGDGYTEIVAAGYSADTVYVFTYAP